MTSQSDIRKVIRAQRAKLSEQEQSNCAYAIYLRLRDLGLFNRHQRFACYLASRGEIDTQPIIEQIWSQKKNCLLPILHWGKPNHLQFLPFTPDTLLIKNRYDIFEPVYDAAQVQALWSIDIIFTPLVAFDTQGHRIGMGGGYYDRTLHFLRQRSAWRKPKLIGLAYDFQKVDHIEAQPWDIPLDCIVTEQTTYKVNRV